MRVLRPFVETLVPAVLDTGHQVLLRGAATGEHIGDDHTRRLALPLQQHAQQALGFPLVPPALDQHVKHHLGLVHGAPEPVLHIGDLDRDLVDVPLAADAGQPPSDQLDRRADARPTAAAK
jgi:hypothetical protein